ncbi:MAG TPA: hypothetical protein VN231_13515 [Allosphingosinicella sp.]|nr:hypothetical protein [Allosphingosinicella sp.]
MSSIPNKAMPHAGGQSETQNQDGQFGQQDEAGTSGGAFSQIADKAREYPKTAIAAGAAVAAGVAAAAVLGTRGRGEKSSAGSKKSDKD